MDESRDARIVVVDDDRIYHPWFIEQMVRESDAHPEVAIAGSGWDVPADLTDRPSTLAATLAGRRRCRFKCTRVRGSQQVDVVQGVSGYLVKLVSSIWPPGRLRRRAGCSVSGRRRVDQRALPGPEDDL
jgi:hypothetical protein